MDNVRFVFSRFLQSLFALLCIITLTFFLARLAPGGPFLDEKAVPEHLLEQMNKKYGFDKPLVVQYGLYLGQLIQGDLGPSLGNKGFTVNEVIAEGLPVSFILGFVGLIIALIIGVPIGVFAAANRNTPVDYGLMTVAMIGICLPTFVIAPILDVLSQDFVRTARAKGLAPSKILFKHAFRGGITPVVAYLGPALAGLIGGSFVVETVFGIPGLGQHFIKAASNRDYTLINGTVTVFAILILIMNFLVDVLQAWLDPRTKTGN
jgi:oligopeptide transport system permease protein